MMASKQVKLRHALTQAIVRFFAQEDLYCDELQIQGTLCVTADKNAIFVTQITETITDDFKPDSQSEVQPTQLPSPHASLIANKDTAAKKKSRTATKPQVSPHFVKSKDLPGLNHLLTTTLPLANENHGGFQPYDALPKYRYNDTNSITQNTAENHQESCSSDSENSLEGCVIVQPSRQNKRSNPPSTSSAKKSKSDTPVQEEEKSALNLTKKGGGARDTSTSTSKSETWMNRPLLAVNSMMAPVFPGNPERQFALNPPTIKQEKPEEGTMDLRVTTSPGTHALHADVNPMSEFPWQLASPPESHGSLTDWPANSWVRKPKTKFSPEQLRSLEDAYQTDPFLSTCAERRAELARKLSLTEKNIQIWFQNQRRRRRAAAYSRMHVSASEGGMNSEGVISLDHEGGTLDPSHPPERDNDEDTIEGRDEYYDDDKMCDQDKIQSAEKLQSTDKQVENSYSVSEDGSSISEGASQNVSSNPAENIQIENP